MNQSIDAARLTLILNDLRLPAIKQGRSSIAERSDKEGWPAARFLATLAEHEIAERDRRRIERHLRSEEHTSELQSLMRISYAVFCLKKTNISNDLSNTLH